MKSARTLTPEIPRADSAPPTTTPQTGGALPPLVSVHLNALLAKVKPQ